MFHLHLELPTWSPPDNQTEVADSAGCHARKIGTITADEAAIRARWRDDAIDLAPHHEQNLRLLRKLVDDANACERMREACREVLRVLENAGTSRDTAETRGAIAGAAGAIRFMLATELNAKLTSDKVIDGLARDIAAHSAEVIARHNAAYNTVYNTRMTPASIAASYDAILHSDDTPPPIDLLDDKLRAEHGADDFAKRAPRIYEDGRPD